MSRAMERLTGLPATFTTAEAERARLWRRDLYRLREAGVLHELSRGVYRRADAAETAHPDLLAVAHRAPRAVVCLLSALVLHELTDEVPIAVQIAVARGTYRPHIDYPPVEVFEFDATTFDLGRELVEVAVGEQVPAYGPARSVVDAMRLRNRLGEPIALRALRHYVLRREAQLGDLITYAQALDVEGPVRRAVEAVLS